jgi:hypothetical protein
MTPAENHIDPNETNEHKTNAQNAFASYQLHHPSGPFIRICRCKGSRSSAS